MTMEWKKYDSIIRHGKNGTNETVKDGDYVVIWEKLDGCFHYNSRVMLADGTEEKIGKIVNQKMDVEVLSLNLETGKFEPKRILNHFNHGKKKRFIGLKIASTNGGRPNIIYCTPDHLFFTDKGWVEAQNLNKNISLCTPFKGVNEYQKQLLLGTAFGDSYIYPKKTEGNNRGIIYSVANKFEEYKKLKDLVLGDLFSYDETYISGYGSECIRTISKINISTEEVLSKCFINNVKTMNEEYFKNLNEVGLAFWYQDDGSLLHNKKQKDRVRLNTQCLSLTENELLVYLFMKYWNMKASIVTENKNEKKYYSINFDTESSEKFFSLISPYVEKSMRYKLPAKFRDNECFWSCYNQNVEGLEKTKLNFLGFVDVPRYAQDTDNYDIEVEDNHNYIINGVVVHNSNASFMLNEDGTEILCFSRNNKLNGGKDGLRGFYEWVQNNINIDCLYSNYIYVGEWLVPHKINYGDNANDFYLFDIYHKENKEYLNEEEVIKESNLLNIKTAPVLKNGIIGKDFTLEEIFAMAGISKLAPDGKGEGIVIKNYSHKHKDGKQVFTKVVTKEFQENNGAKIKIAKVSDPLGEFVDKTVTEARVEKMLLKLVDEGKIPEDYDLEHMGLILKSLGSSIADDIIKEELDELLKIVKGKIGRKVPNIVKEIVTKNV